MNKMKFSFIWAGIAAFILWLISIFVPITPLVIVLFLFVVVGAGIYGGTIRLGPAPGAFEVKGAVTVGGKGKGWTFNWDWKDWGGLILLILVVAALIKGANPIGIIEAIKPFFGGGQ